MRLRVLDTPTDVATDSAAILARRIRRAVADRGGATIAVSGGRSTAEMFDALAAHDLPWSSLQVFQVDERVAPTGHEARNAGLLSLLPVPERNLHLMPVETPVETPVERSDLDAAARSYAESLPARFDVVHLGIGEDGHTASWAPGDPVIDEPGTTGICNRYAGYVRMTLTPVAVNGARSRIVVVAGASKAPAVRRWLLDDPSVPVQRVRRSSTTVVLDVAAASELVIDPH